jgi:hypothetical protein
LEKMADDARPVPLRDIAMPASPQKSSSWTSGISRPDGSMKRLTLASRPYRPILAASWITGQGVSSRSSHSAAAGRMTSAAKVWAQFRISCCSVFRASEKWLQPGLARSAPSSPASAITSAETTGFGSVINILTSEQGELGESRGRPHGGTGQTPDAPGGTARQAECYPRV